MIARDRPGRPDVSIAMAIVNFVWVHSSQSRLCTVVGLGRLSHLLENVDHLRIIRVMAVNSGEQEFAPNGCPVALQAAFPQCWVLAPADDGGDGLTTCCLAPGRSSEGVFLDIFFILWVGCSLAKSYASALVVEAAVFSQQYTDKKINCCWVVGVDGRGAVEEENGHAANKVEGLSSPMDSRLVCVHDEPEIKV